MRIKAFVATQAGRILRPAGAVFELDDAAAKQMIADGRAELAIDSKPVTGTGAGPAASSSKPKDKRAKAKEPAESPASGSGQASGAPDVGELDADEAEFYATLEEDDAIAYVDGSQSEVDTPIAEQLQHLQQVRKAEL